MELERLCAHLACLCQRLRGSGPTPHPAEAGARGTFCWPAAGRERPKRSSHFFTRFPRRLCSGRGCPIPLSPTASLSKIHLSPQSLPQTPVDSPGPSGCPEGREQLTERTCHSLPPPACPGIPAGKLCSRHQCFSNCKLHTGPCRACKNADSDSVGKEWGPRVCISNKLSGDIEAASLGTIRQYVPRSRSQRFIKAVSRVS